jgi:hypothetical protein
MNSRGIVSVKLIELTDTRGGKMIMKAKRLTIALVFVVSILFITQTASAQRRGARGGGESVFITSIGFSSDAAGTKHLSGVDPGTRSVYCYLDIGEPAPSSTFKFVVTFFDRATGQRTEVLSQELSNQSGKTISTKVAPPGGLKAGSYDFQIFIDGRGRNHARLVVIKNQT